MDNVARSLKFTNEAKPIFIPSTGNGSSSQREGCSDVSATRPDWAREIVRTAQWMPGMQLLHTVRGYQRWRHRYGIVGRVIAATFYLRHRLWSVIAGADIPVTAASLGGGLVLMHANGIVIHPETIIGPNCMIFQQVTIGTREGRIGLPTIGGHVDIGAGAKVLGPVTIGDHAKIGANAVVICDVPVGATAVGVPARILPDKSSTNPADLAICRSGESSNGVRIYE